MIRINVTGKLILFTLLNVFLLNGAFAQSLEEVTKSYNDAIQVANTTPDVSFASFTDLLPKVEALGEEGADIAKKIKDVLPSLQYKTALKAYNSKDIKNAIAGFENAIVLSDKYENTEIPAQINAKLPALYYSNGNGLLKAKDVSGATAAYNKAIAANPKYAKGYYGLSKTFRAQSKIDSVLAYAQKAIDAAGDNAKSIASFKSGTKKYLYKAASAKAKGKKHKEAIDLFKKALTYSNGKKEEKYHYKLAKSYQALGKNSDACASYKKIKSGKYLEGAKYEMEQKLKCN